MVSDNFDYKDLDNLRPEEREAVLKILGELSETGSSQLYEDIIYSDYKERPVDFFTFIDDDRYLGRAWKDEEGKSKLYPYWRRRLVELFPDNISTAVNNAIFSGCRGIGKSELAVTICCYLMYRVMCLKKPLEHFHLKPTETIAFAFMNITQTLSEEIGISKFQNTVQLSPWFMEHGTMTGRTNKIWTPPSYINIIIGSQAKDVIGQAVLFAFFDEISFIRNQDIDKQKAIAIDMINTAIGGMKTRFLHNGKSEAMLILASSKRSEKSFLEVHMKKELAAEKENVFIVDEAIWNVKPPETYSGRKFYVALGNKFLTSLVIPDMETNFIAYKNRGYKILEVPEEFKADFKKDIDRALCDYAGISSSELSKYISGAVWHDTCNEKLVNPFNMDIIEVGDAKEDTAQYKDFFDLEKIDPIMKSRPLFIHMDMSVSGDMTGIAGVWIKGKAVAQEGRAAADELYFRLAFSVSVKAPKGRQISFEKNRNFIYWLKEKGFKIKGVTTDTFQSVDTGQALTAKGFNYEALSVDRVDTDHICKPYQFFRSCIYEQKIETYASETLTDEIIDLERNINTGKVDHPEGGRKDVADAVCGALFNASRHAEEFAFDYGETLDTIIKNNSSAANDLQQVQVDFQEELKKMFDPLTKAKTAAEQRNQKQEKKSTNQETQPYLDFGMGRAQPLQQNYLSQGIIIL